MRSELLALSLLVVACGRLNDLSLDAPPLAHVQTEIDTTDPRWQGIDGQLYVGLAWVRAREFSSVCSKVAGHPDLAKACPDPFSVDLFDLAATAPLDLTTGRVTLDLDRLPDARVSVGDLGGRVAYGTLIVFREFDGNGWLDRLFVPRGQRGRRGDEERVDNREQILGASFFSMIERHQRVTFLEGEWQPISLFYPTIGCTTPPQGLSVMDAVLSLTLTPEPKLDGDCQVRGVDTPVRIRPLSRDEARSLECPQAPRRLRDPLDDAADGDLPEDLSGGVCLDAETFALVEQRDGAACGQLRVWALSGCRDGDSKCEEPNWDHRTNPPAWWSCK